MFACLCVSLRESLCVAHAYRCTRAAAGPPAVVQHLTPTAAVGGDAEVGEESLQLLEEVAVASQVLELGHHVLPANLGDARGILPGQARRLRIRRVDDGGLDEILTSYTEIFANNDSYEDPDKRKAMEQIKTLLDGVLDARGRVLMKLNVGASELDAVISVLPSMKAPTVNELWDGGGFAVETVVNKSDINVLIPQLLELGATDVIELPISKIVP